MAIHQLLQPYRPGDSDSFDRTKAAHLLNRAGFGGTEADVEKALKLGLSGAVQWLLGFADKPAEAQTPKDVPDLSMLDEIEGKPFPRTFRDRQKLLAGKSQEERQALGQKMAAAHRQAIGQIGSWWLKRLASGPYPLQEKLALFWHGHFTTSAREARSAWLIWKQNELLRRHAAGNFGEFVHAISRDPAMLEYLNNQQNRKQKPNENYARELMELFTLGIGNYTETDVKEAARAFTGWAHDGDEYAFNPRNHDEGEKVFLGQRGRFGGDEVIEIILAKPECARYIAGRVFSFFAYEDAEPALIESLASVLRRAKYDLRPMLAHLFTSRAFYSPRAMGSQIKSPVQLMMGTVRLMGLPMPPLQVLNRQLTLMGQVPLNPPNVKGWPGGREWINTSTLFARYNAASALAAGELPGWRLRPAQRPKHTIEGKATPEALVDAWVDRLIQRPIEESKRRVLIEALGGKANQEESAKKMVQLMVSMPEYQLC